MFDGHVSCNYDIPNSGQVNNTDLSQPYGRQKFQS